MTFTIQEIHKATRALFTPERVWLAREMERNELHPAVLAAFNKVGAITEAVLLQWPHRSVVDPTQLAYTRSEEQGRIDRQTRTAVGKYLRAAFPSLKDNEIRDLVYKIESQVADGFEIVTTGQEIVHAAVYGPHSCMSWDHHDVENEWQTHPYACYCPKLGWSLAQRKRGADIVSRALLYTDDDITLGKTVWVRTYGYDGEGEALAGWLHGKEGFEHRGSWPYGAKLAKLTGHDSDWLFPYLDGDREQVDVQRDHLRIVDRGEYCCVNTDGTADHASQAECEHCGCDVDEDDLRGVGRYGDERVCDDCISSDFTYVIGRSGDEYYVHEDNAIEIDGSYYDKDYPPKPLKELRNGDWAFEENCVQIGGDWYHKDDEDIVLTEDSVWCRCENTWTCTATGNVYSTNEASVEWEGDTYHPNDAPNTEPEGSISNETQLPLEAA